MIETIASSMNQSVKEEALILWFNQVRIEDVGLVGGKNASLGEMIQQLESAGVKVPNGFATTAYAYRYFLEKGGLTVKLRELFNKLDVNNVNNLRQIGQQARNLILQTPLPDDLTQAIAINYQKLSELYGGVDIDVAVRSSATAEDLPDASFAGQQETFLNIQTVKGVIEACHKCFASLFTDRAISYRHTKGYDHFNIALSVGIQKMVNSLTSGVMFSIDTETGFQDTVLINAAYGLGENVVQGAVNPDEYLVFKPTLKAGFKPIIDKKVGSKELRMVCDVGGCKITKQEKVSPLDQQKFALNNEDILQLAKWAVTIENHYSQVRGVLTPMDMEWAKDANSNELFIVQARPETVQSQKNKTVIKNYQFTTAERPAAIVTGRSIGEAIGQGKARVILDTNQMELFQDGEILVTNKTDPDWEPIMKRASAIITNQGGRTCHSAIIARELGIPAIVGTSNATNLLTTGSTITVACNEGEDGKVYPGLLPYEIKEIPLDNIPRTRTKIMMNVGNPDEALSLSAMPSDGVGLARLEFIIANYIKVHPLALINYDRLANEAARIQIQQLTINHPHKPDYFIDKLAQGIAKIAAAFYPRSVIVRMSDFKSNEYANLLGGKQFEPDEENPMIGWRGASRYYDNAYRDAYALECQAIKRVRDEMGLTNVIPMIPFCRTPEEGKKVLAEMEKSGLKRGENGLQVYVMCEIPSNVILATEFSEIFDGFSIGSNDLTQLTMGLDRDSALVAHLFDERNLAVKKMVELVITTVKKTGHKIGICGQAPSDYPEFAKFLVELGIDSISLNPDSVLKTMLMIAEVESN